MDVDVDAKQHHLINFTQNLTNIAVNRDNPYCYF